MSAEETIRKLLAGGGQALVDDERKAARVAWVKATVTALRQAHRRVDDAWERMLAALPDDLDEEELDAIPPPPEQAELDAIHAQIRAVIDHDRWPRHLYFSRI